MNSRITLFKRRLGRPHELRLPALSVAPVSRLDDMLTGKSRRRVGRGNPLLWIALANVVKFSKSSDCAKSSRGVFWTHRQSVHLPLAPA